MELRPYGTDYTDLQFIVLDPLLPPSKRRGGPRANLQGVLNALL